MFSKQELHRTLPVGILAMLLACSVLAQVRYDATKPAFTTRLSTTTRILLPEKILPYISLGFDTFLADMYWVRSIQDLVTWDGKDPYYLDYFKNITTLDPKFEYPYLFAILAYPQSAKKDKNVDELTALTPLVERGITAIPSSWQIPFYFATQYFIYTKQYHPAEDYLKIAAEKKGAPDGVYLVYSTFVGRNVVRNKNVINDEKSVLLATQDLVKVIYNNTDSETIKDLAKAGYESARIHQMLEKGIIAYKERYKKYPSDVTDLFAANFINLPNDFLNHFSVMINKRTGVFSIEEKK